MDNLTWKQELDQALRTDAAIFGPELAQQAYQRGLAVTGANGGTTPIPITATAVVIAESELKKRVALSATLASAGSKMARAIIDGPNRELLLEALSPLERALASKTHLATA